MGLFAILFGRRRRRGGESATSSVDPAYGAGASSGAGHRADQDRFGEDGGRSGETAGSGPHDHDHAGQHGGHDHGHADGGPSDGGGGDGGGGGGGGGD